MTKQTLKLLLILLLATFNSFGQTADEIINNYFENIGGKEKLEKLSGLKMVGIMKVSNMEIPFYMTQTKKGEQLLEIELQGKKMIWTSFDGEIAWQRNQMTMEAEKSDNETTENLKKEVKEFPDPFLNYKEKGYLVELIGKETVDGTETFKIKLTKEPLLFNGELKPNIDHYYFDTENFVPIAKEEITTQGSMAGQTIQSSLSDYQEVNGIYFPFSLTNTLQSMEIKEIIIDPEVDKTSLEFPTK